MRRQNSNKKRIYCREAEWHAELRLVHAPRYCLHYYLRESYPSSDYIGFILRVLIDVVCTVWKPPNFTEQLSRAPNTIQPDTGMWTYDASSFGRSHPSCQDWDTCVLVLFCLIRACCLPWIMDCISVNVLWAPFQPGCILLKGMRTVRHCFRGGECRPRGRVWVLYCCR